MIFHIRNTIKFILNKLCNNESQFYLSSIVIKDNQFRALCRVIYKPSGI